MTTANTNSILKKTSLGVAAAVIATMAVQGSAQAKPSFSLYIGAPGVFLGTGPVYGYNHWRHYNPCLRWKRKFYRTGRYKYLKRYNRCMWRHF